MTDIEVVKLDSLIKLGWRRRFKAWRHQRRIDRLLTKEAQRELNQKLDDFFIHGRAR